MKVDLQFVKTIHSELIRDLREELTDMMNTKSIVSIDEMESARRLLSYLEQVQVCIDEYEKNKGWYK